MLFCHKFDVARMSMPAANADNRSWQITRLTYSYEQDGVDVLAANMNTSVEVQPMKSMLVYSEIMCSALTFPCIEALERGRLRHDKLKPLLLLYFCDLLVQGLH